ncbi:MAG: 5-(carboxyamino)imidazole ribonucleotide mutase [Deltaproteobacteria bacterium]|nr:5-(carboxyamino)imidazole ribonucleotide mutase [Deltaproteobacteria bacterium]MBU52020.1 5-(carboxyamino)imidazole ribonucleotide mutase [Deltaproteobacteria bacterium]|tara:strand:+ start:4121 stop:4657 length:537 start_codon:yes stop_codon:yes gene_type:complete
MENPLIGVVISAENELPYMEECERILVGFGIPYEIRVLSIHQAPEKCIEWAKSAASRGLHAIVCGVGWSAPLASVLAAHTILPVIAVPLPVSSMHGLDSLMGMAQTNLGAPIATMAVGKSGAANAGLFAAQLLCLKYPHLVESINSFRAGLSQQVEAKDAALMQDRMRRMSGGGNPPA